MIGTRYVGRSASCPTITVESSYSATSRTSPPGKRANALGVREGTVKSRLNRALEQLREILGS